MEINEINFLVVEDDVFQRQIMKTMLTQLGAKTIWDVDNGKIALDVLRNQQEIYVDIIVCDLNMPEMDGLEFLRHLGQEHHNVSIILLSALGSNLLVSAGKIAKLHGIKLLGAIDKPIMPVHLGELLSKFTRSEKKLQAFRTLQKFPIEEILKGIEEKQFEPFYQPKVDFKTGQIIGAETLARWLHPEHGLIPPNSFIPPLESCGKIDELTFLILEKATQVLPHLKKKNEKFTLSINLSPDSLDNTALADKVNKIVRNAKLEPRNFIIEITESVAMTDVAHALENLARLYMNGFSLSIDDYGTGFSSMQQLTRIAFSELKIDQSFVRDFAENKELRIMVKASIDMAHKLGMKCVAEGVETLEEWEILKNMNCDIMQGYFVAKPMSFKDFMDFWGAYIPKTSNYKDNKLGHPKF